MNDCRARWICPYALRYVRCYRFTQWINLVVCLLDYEWCTGEINQPLRLGVFTDITQWINLVMCLLNYEWCTGEMNLPLRLRCVRWYYAMNKPCGVFVELWMMYWRDKSAPTPTECSLIYILRNEWALWSVRWIMNDCRARWICPYAYGVFVDIHFTQWMSLVECPLIYILSNK